MSTEKGNPPRLVATAERVGPHTHELVNRLLSSKTHPEQAYRPCLGIVRLADKYGAATWKTILVSHSYRSPDDDD